MTTSSDFLGTNQLDVKEVEESVIAAMFTSRVAAESAIEICNASDFYYPRHSEVFAAIESLLKDGGGIDLITVVDRCISENPNTLVDPDFIITIQFATFSVANVGHYAQIVQRKSMGRRLQEAMNWINGDLSEGLDPYEAVDELEKVLATVGSKSTGKQEALTVSEIKNKAKDTSQWIIPGVFRRHWKVVITGFEGGGKGVLLRMMCMAAAQGIHPFTQRRMEPIRTLLLDAENPDDAFLETAEMLERTLVDTLGSDYDETRFRTYQVRGFDLRNKRDLTGFKRELALQQPDLLAVGPLYKLKKKKPGESYEDEAAAYIDIFDKIMATYNCGLLVEHHAKKGDGKSLRGLETMGSELWTAWPDTIYGLRPREENEHNLDLENQRGDRVAAMNWPDYIERDPDWVIHGRWNSPRRPPA